ncbi:MAG TPA: hypothetical protein VFN96_10625, partial [Gemmatimonadales bacterium]|nr:hypothetical protein [Gemmatimonadales bacterium]
YPVEVGSKTDLYEVEAPGSLRLTPGVTYRAVTGPDGRDNALVLLRQNGEIGGYMVCGCAESMGNYCKTINDNPNHPLCGGGCTNSEGKAVTCSMFGPLPGPPKDPLLIRLRARGPMKERPEAER